jgi:hypothetical protein
MPCISEPYARFKLHLSDQHLRADTSKNLDGRLLYDPITKVVGPVLRLVDDQSCGGQLLYQASEDCNGDPYKFEDHSEWVASFVAADFVHSSGLGAHCLRFEDDFVVGGDGFVYFSNTSVIFHRFFVRDRGVLQLGRGILPGPDAEPVALEECMVTCLTSYGMDAYRDPAATPVSGHGTLVSWGTQFHFASPERSDFDLGPDSVVRLYASTLCGSRASYHHFLSSDLTFDHVTFKGCEAPEFMCTPRLLRRFSSINNQCGMSFYPPTEGGHVTVTDLLVVHPHTAVIKRNHRNRLLLVDPHLPDVDGGRFPGTAPVCLVRTVRPRVLGCDGYPVADAVVRYVEASLGVTEVCGDRVTLAEPTGFTHVREGESVELCNHEYRVAMVLSPTEILIEPPAAHGMTDTNLTVYHERRTDAHGWVTAPIWARTRCLPRDSRTWVEFPPAQVFVTHPGGSEVQPYGEAPHGEVLVLGGGGGGGGGGEGDRLREEYAKLTARWDTLRREHIDLQRKAHQLRAKLSCAGKAAGGHWEKKYRDLEGRFHLLEQKTNQTQCWEDRYHTLETQKQCWEDRYHTLEETQTQCCSGDPTVLRLQNDNQLLQRTIGHLELGVQGLHGDRTELEHSLHELQQTVDRLTDQADHCGEVVHQHLNTHLRAHLWHQQCLHLGGFVTNPMMLVLLVEYIHRCLWVMSTRDTQWRLYDPDWVIEPQHLDIALLYRRHIEFGCQVCKEPRFVPSGRFLTFRDLRRYVYNLTVRGFTQNWHSYDQLTRVILCRWHLVPFVYNQQVLTTTQTHVFHQEYSHLNATNHH